MPDIEAALRRAMVDLHAFQREAVVRDGRFTWNCWARQTGKSFTFSLRRVARGLARRRNQIILSAGERQSREVMEKVRQHCRAMRVWCEWRGDLHFRKTSIRQLEVRLPGNIRVIGLPANPMTARGFTGDVFLDEFAMHQDADAIWSALFPTLLRGKGELDVASTPRGRKNMFYRLRRNKQFSHTTISLKEAIAQGLEVDAAVMQGGMHDEIAWRQEFCCEFVDESTSFLTLALIRGCEDARLRVEVDWKCLQRAKAQVYVGVDVGRHRDVTAAWLWERQGDELIARGVVVLQDAPFGEQEATLRRILEQRGVRRCCIDAGGLGMQLAERLTERFGEHRVESVVFTTALKSELAGALRVLAERGLLRIPPDDAIANDWHSIARVVTGAGNVRYEGDRSDGGHGDRFWAAALGVHAAQELVGGAGFEAGGRLTFAREGIW